MEKLRKVAAPYAEIEKMSRYHSIVYNRFVIPAIASSSGKMRLTKAESEVSMLIPFKYL
jgi:hypothetical protein